MNYEHLKNIDSHWMTIMGLRLCALGWVPDAELLGRVTAQQLRDWCDELLDFKEKYPDNKIGEISHLGNQIFRYTECWTPRTCVLGNVTAQEILALCHFVLSTPPRTLCDECLKYRKSYGNCDQTFGDTCACQCHLRML